jgi:arabinose-5-phosphate isomerase
MNDEERILAFGREVAERETEAAREVLRRIGPAFVAAVRLIESCTGRVIVTGVGKAGIIGRKISATLASTGTPSYWMHAVEAQHGDMGRVLAEDVVLALSNSGETEVVQLLPTLKKLGTRIIALTGRDESTLARYADVVLSIGDTREACPLGLAPSASTTAMLVMGDALALTLFRLKNWTPEEFAFYHPGGDLGRRLIKVERVMRTSGRNPVAPETISVREALDAMSVEGSPGAVSLVDAGGRLTGFFTDGDFRRLVRARSDVPALLAEPVSDHMTPDPKRVSSSDLASDAFRLMQRHRIDQLPVVDDGGVPVGMIDVQDWLDIDRGLEQPG